MPIIIVNSKFELSVTKDEERKAIKANSRVYVYGTDSAYMYKDNCRDINSIGIHAFILNNSGEIKKSIRISDNGEECYNHMAVYFSDDNLIEIISPESCDNKMSIEELIIPAFLVAPRLIMKFYPVFIKELERQGYSSKYIPAPSQIFSMESLNRFFNSGAHYNKTDHAFQYRYRNFIKKWGIKKCQLT